MAALVALLLAVACPAQVTAEGFLRDAMAPWTQMGRALREAGVYHKRPVIQAELAAAGVEMATLGGLRTKPPSDLLNEILATAGVPAAKRTALVAKYGGPAIHRPLLLTFGGERININEPYQLERRLTEAQVSPEARHALIAERSRGEFKDLADFEARLSKQSSLDGEVAKTVARVVDASPAATTGTSQAQNPAGQSKATAPSDATAAGAAPKAPDAAPAKTSTPRGGPAGPTMGAGSAVVAKLPVRLRDFLTHQPNGRSLLPNAAQKYFASPMQSLLTLMVFQAAMQYRATGRIDVGKAVAATLDSPQVWAGLIAAGATAHMVNSLRATLAKDTGMRALFGRMLGGLPGSIAAFAAWEIGAGYISAATKGVQVPGKEKGEEVTFSDMFRHPGVGAEVLGNLGKIAINPMAQAQILGRVLKDRILTAEFFFTAAGMWAGTKVGAFAGVKVGAWAGAAFGPVGIGIGATAGGILGGIAGGVIGGFGGAWAGSAVDTWMARRAYSKAKEAIEKADADPAKRRELGAKGMAQALDAFDEARQKLVDKLTTDFAGKAKRYLSEKDLPKAPPGKEPSEEEVARRNQGIMSRHREVEASRVAILDLFREELELLAKLIEGARKRGEDPAPLIERENRVVMEMTLFLVGTSQAIGELKEPMPGDAIGVWGDGLDAPRPEGAPSFQGLAAPAEPAPAH
ncbi:MAG: hypothetical protein HYY25_08275 [Candidatus Wallbacteria bacterium]|nr:hypothetical protein [Candidatus Wallbacteria bacterium]